ncbi:3-oxo-tetronate kinase [Jannaschia marina]|uniref:3-oxo-tetronate kinase n=1 Tax=Jannaschia marina TaxID=2741674 RepID=UPI0015C7FD4A|nr:3-oxo-tetronate kinase [Jannaschia marina]
MLIGVIADDFTGASDIANTLSKGLPGSGGLRTAQFSGRPEEAADPTIEAGVIALKSRTAPVEQAVGDSLAALDWLRAQGCRQIVFKICSTFDSTPAGNIGPVADALAAELGAETVVVCPAFPAAGRTVYRGHLFVFDRLLSESGMETHPLTPMTDPDLRRWLARQTARPVGHLPLERLATDTARIDAGPGYLVADVVSEADLVALGRRLVNAPLVVGGSGIAMGLPQNLIDAGLAPGHTPEGHAIDGPGAILAGSCSGATRGQVERHAANHPTHAIDVTRVMSGTEGAAELTAFFAAHATEAPLAYSSASPAEVAALQDRFGRAEVAARLDALFAETARLLLDRGVRRLVVAGGETSGAVAQAVTDHLGVGAMRIGPEIDPGVPILTVGHARPVGLALKSGNFGSPDFFGKALQAMARP